MKLLENRHATACGRRVLPSAAAQNPPTRALVSIDPPPPRPPPPPGSVMRCLTTRRVSAAAGALEGRSTYTPTAIRGTSWSSPGDYGRAGRPIEAAAKKMGVAPAHAPASIRKHTSRTPTPYRGRDAADYGEPRPTARPTKTEGARTSGAPTRSRWR